MSYLIGAAAFVVGSVAMLLVIAALRAKESRRRKTRRTATGPPKKKRKFEFVKIILILVLFTYFVGVYIGVKVALIDFSQLGVLLAFIGTPTAAAIGFYCWKAKAENIIKIKKDNPEETEGVPVDLNNINT